ncbi:unnamed protein product [Gongylonema pulchrum]|uniref:PRKC apoptosis WT1 regulator protein n=1 Tax=Gongylonema pulchrum TaxID=637853 RepID=A0A183DTM1_9BILA|nr:unnamed protein product [Gongylonema pulchrum]
MSTYCEIDLILLFTVSVAVNSGTANCKKFQYDLRREESVELRAILAARFERRAQTSNSPRPDSGQWSGVHSDDESSWGDLDEELSVERQCRQLKAHIQTLSRTVAERNTEIERLENRLNELAPTKGPMLSGSENKP